MRQRKYDYDQKQEQQGIEQDTAHNPYDSLNPHQLPPLYPKEHSELPVKSLVNEKLSIKSTPIPEKLNECPDFESE